MKEIIKVIIEDLMNYNGKSLLLPIFLVALIGLWVSEKDKNKRAVLVYLATTVILVFVCPLYAWIGIKIDSEIYYRVLWALPIGIVFCYSAIKLLMHFENKIIKMLIFAVTIMVICVNGKNVYKNTIYFKSTNTYHIPQQVIDIADTLKLDNYRPIAVIPAELLPFFHQYTADVFTPYGRNILEPQWTFYDELYEVMENDSGVYNASEVARCARNSHCMYVVLSSAKPIEGSMEALNYFLYDIVQGYYIYVDYNYFDVLKEQNLLDEDILTKGETLR